MAGRFAIFIQSFVVFQCSDDDVALLSVAKTTNLVRETRKHHCDVKTAVVQRATELIDQRDVLFDQLALTAPLSRLAKYI